MPYIFAVVAAIVLASPFGAVEGSAVDDTNGLVVNITVEVDRTFEALLVRPFSSYEELPPTALRLVEDGTWSGAVTFPTAENWSVVFDGLQGDGESFRSETVTLIEIGVDPVVVAGDPAALPRRSIDSATWWLIGAMASAIFAIAALVWWTFTGPDVD